MPPAFWPPIAPPRAPRVDHWIEQLGRRRNDTYAWMQFVPATGSRTLETLPQPLRAHLEAEMRYADDMLAPLAPQALRFLERMRERAPHIDMQPPTHRKAGATAPGYRRAARTASSPASRPRGRSTPCSTKPSARKATPTTAPPATSTARTIASSPGPRT